jgi:ribosomal-protein-alanine N-acetyltransferase
MEFTQLPLSPIAHAGLRHLTPADIPAWYAYLSLPTVFEHTSWNLGSPDALADYVWDPMQNTPDRLLRLAVVRPEDDLLVGTIGFHTVSSVNASAELAYDLSPTLWGRGIASALCQVMVSWAHGHVGLTRVQATVLDTNVRSQRVLERSGFAREGLLRSYRMVRGVPRDFVMHSHIERRS